MQQQTAVERCSKRGFKQDAQSSTPQPLAGLLAHLQYPLQQLQATPTAPQAGRCAWHSVVWAHRCAGSSAAADAFCLCLMAPMLARGRVLAPHVLPSFKPGPWT